MPDHVQPTAEELQKQLDETLSKLEEPAPSEPQPSEPQPSEPEPSEPIPSEPQPSEPAPSEPTEEPEPSKEAEPEKKEPPTTEERYKESTREAQRLYRNNVQMNEAIKEANALPEPTEAELQQEYAEWDDMSDVEKRLATETFINKRFRDHINKASEAQRSVDEWVDRVGKFVDDPKTLIDYPDLEGKVEAFKTYSDDKKLVGTDFAVLVKGFLYDHAQKQVKHKGKMMETGQGGDKRPAKPANDKISLEEANKLMKTDYAKYRELLKAGKIQMDIS